MVDFNKGLLTGRAEGFDAFLQFTFGSDNYRLKSLQTVNTSYVFNKRDVYNDAGFKVRVRDTYILRADIELVLTVDDFDTADPPTDTKTISFFLDQKLKGNQITIAVIQVFKTKAVTNPFLRQTFTMDLDEVGTARQVGDTVKLPINGEILDGQIGSETIPKHIRSAT